MGKEITEQERLSQLQKQCNNGTLDYGSQTTNSAGNANNYFSNDFLLAIGVEDKSSKEINILDGESGLFYTSVFNEYFTGKDYKSIYLKFTAFDEAEIKEMLFNFFKEYRIDNNEEVRIYNKYFIYGSDGFHRSVNYTKDDIKLFRNNRIKTNYFDIIGSSNGFYIPPYNPSGETTQSEDNSDTFKTKIDNTVKYLINDSPNIEDDLDYISSNSITMFDSIIEHEDMVKEIVKRNISDLISEDVNRIANVALEDNHRM